MREKISSMTIAASLNTSSGYPFTHPLVYGLSALCVVTLLLFVWIENKALEPILPMSLLTRLQPSLVLVAFVLLTTTMFARASWHSLLRTCKLTGYRRIDLHATGLPTCHPRFERFADRPAASSF